MRFSALVVLSVITLASAQNNSSKDDCVTQCTIQGEQANENNSSILRCAVDTNPSGSAPCPCQTDGIIPAIASCLKNCPDSVAKTDLENLCNSQSHQPSGDSSSTTWNAAGLFIGPAAVILAGSFLM